MTGVGRPQGVAPALFARGRVEGRDHVVRRRREGGDDDVGAGGDAGVAAAEGADPAQLEVQRSVARR